jgi:GTP cyclohydrolase II
MAGPDPVLVRIHSECLTGDVLGSVRCDCGRQLNEALDRIQKKGWGALLYLRQEGRGIGLHAKIQAYHLQDEGADTLEANLMLGLPADARNYRIAAEMLSALKVEAVNLLSNNPDKENQLSEHGIKVVDRTPWVVGVGDDNRGYLQTKANRMGHDISEKDLK